MLTDFSNVNTIAFYVTLGFIAGVVVLMVLLLRSGKGYSVEDTEAHATEFAGHVKEGHGGITAFLWLLFIGVFIWTIVYFVMHWSEFAVITTFAQ